MWNISKTWSIYSSNLTKHYRLGRSMSHCKKKHTNEQRFDWQSLKKQNTTGIIVWHSPMFIRLGRRMSHCKNKTKYSHHTNKNMDYNTTLTNQHGLCRWVPVSMTQTPKGSIPTGHDYPIVGGKDREPLASCNPSDALPLEALYHSRPTPPVLKGSSTQLAPSPLTPCVHHKFCWFGVGGLV